MSIVKYCESHYVTILDMYGLLAVKRYALGIKYSHVA